MEKGTLFKHLAILQEIEQLVAGQCPVDCACSISERFSNV